MKAIVWGRAISDELDRYSSTTINQCIYILVEFGGPIT